MRISLSKYLLLPILFFNLFINILNAVTFEINESNEKEGINLPFKIRIYSPEKYKLPFAKIKITSGEARTLELSNLLSNVSANMKNSKSVVISCEPSLKGTDYAKYGSNVLCVLQIDDFSNDKISAIDKKTLKICFSLDSFMHHIHMDLQQ